MFFRNLSRSKRHSRIISIVLLLSLIVVSTFTATRSARADADITITFAAYSVPRAAYAEIIPLFEQQWKDKTGKTVAFKESYQGSGAQSRAIVGGLEADIAALSLEPDITRLVKANLITHDWKKGDYKGFVTDSIVVLAVRKDNPKQIQDWADLAKSGIEVITPDPASSGGAQWNILAAYGAARRGFVTGYDKSNDGGLKFLGDLFKNVSVMDKDGSTSFLTFENGVGDVAISYENEAFASLKAGTEAQIVYPSSTILIENPVSVVDTYVDKHGTRDVAEAFVNFLTTPDIQRVFAKYGYRPVDQTIAKDETIAKQFPVVKDLFTIDEFTSWDKVGTDIFGKTGSVTNLLANLQGK